MPYKAGKGYEDPFDKMARAGRAQEKKYQGLVPEGRESFYSMDATPEQQTKYDEEAFGYLRKMYNQDVESGIAENLDYDQYLKGLSGSYWHERVNLPTDKDPDYYKQAGDLFFNIYEGDFDSFVASAKRGRPQWKDSGKY